MKLFPILFSAATFLLAASCSSTKSTSKIPDDVYYSSRDHQTEPQPASAVTTPSASDYSRDNSNYNPDPNSNYGQNSSDNSGQSSSSTQQYSDDKGNTYVTNNYYNDDDYYDYQYSARLKRYYSPAIGYSYYDQFYTNSYWYDYNPYNYGVSIYLGYNWWAPSYCYTNPFWYAPVYSHHHHYGYYDSWNSPYGYYGYNNYWNGYNHGYNDGYWNGYYASNYNNPYYYNSYDGNVNYYGPRGSISSNGKTNTTSPRATLGEKYQRAVTEKTIPVLGTHGVTGTQVTTNPGGVRNNTTTGVVQGAGKTEVNPVRKNDVVSGGKTNVITEPKRDPVSVKNEADGKTDVRENPKVDPSTYSTPRKVNTVGIGQEPKDNGGTVRPAVDQPVRGSDVNFTRPKNKDVTIDPRQNNGGTVRPNVEQPREIQPRGNGNTQPRDNNQYSRPRNEGVTPNTNPRIVQPNVQPRTSPSYERPRQEILPRVEPRQEPRQYKQETTPPRQKESISTPAPRQQNTTEPSPRKQSSGSENKSGGKRK